MSRRLRQRFGGFVSLTFSRSEIESTPQSEARVSPFDRWYVLQIGGSADLGRGYRASLRFVSYAGWPHGSPAPTATRLPPFARLDGRFEKRWSWRKTGHISLVLEVLNATASEEVVSRNCPGTAPCTDNTFGPIVVPSIGVEGAL